MKHPALAIVPVLLLSITIVAAQDAPVDWTSLASEFSQNVVAAEAKYQGKMITVTGPVSAIEAGDMTVDNPSVAVTLSTPDGPGPGVKCLFENEDQINRTELSVDGDGSEAVLIKRDQAGNVVSSQSFVQTGQVIVVTGSFMGYQAGNIVLQHSRLAGSSQ